MMNPPIHRQHETTSLSEIEGQRCLAFQAVSAADEKCYGPLYLQLTSGWHRFYLDAGLLFWEEGPAPDPENDLLEGEHYLDLAVKLRVVGSTVAKVKMAYCRLMMKFANGACLLLKNGVQEWGQK